MGVVITVANQKGGVGKTTIAFNLVKELAQRQHRILAIDNDPQGNLTTAVLKDISSLTANMIDVYKADDASVEPQEIIANLDFIGADIRLARVADQSDDIIYRLSEYLGKVAGNYEYVIIDCLPSFGYLMKAALKAADYVLIPAKPSPFALMGLTDLMDTVEKVRRRINPKLKVLGIVLNLVEGRSTVLSDDLQEIIRKQYGDKVFDTELVKGVKFEESIMFNQSITEYEPNAKGSINFHQFTDELLLRLNGRKEA